ncbi:carcinoembryonic antigen-related cell adhesion molecule 1-like [Chanos chanos]|uniref:Carcinoembryonic antigen-related cell adhesion molecule 1-like n=1 Tax=Chanos chanos TaxID=29144 RepID=A0A6J2WAR7_CHACN|nr:carcinoembryonic antigen-related cell adhesion molecule 1-like [Chanos chanos]
MHLSKENDPSKELYPQADTVGFLQGEKVLIVGNNGTYSGVSLTGPAEPLIEDQSSADLTCEGIGSIITTEWMKDGQPLSPSNSIIFSADLRSVSISPVRRSDSGEYQCRLSNPVSSDTATYTVTVSYGPENVSISGQNEVEVGSKVTLTCSAESTPPASFIWMLNGRETGETTASYSIEKIDSTHSRNYTCTAWNNVTSLKTTVHHHLTVKGKVSLHFQEANRKQVELGILGGEVKLNSAANQRALQLILDCDMTCVVFSDACDIVACTCCCVDVFSVLDSSPYACDVTKCEKR